GGIRSTPARKTVPKLIGQISYHPMGPSLLSANNFPQNRQLFQNVRRRLTLQSTYGRKQIPQ
ncbi:MAG: hypothetical protein MN733_30095, partial [Nitrososphaera sp.]|nr:hypothetical protein [Nitrososphaera sp.]